MEAALYDDGDGFYQTGGRAGRGGDFVTSPEIGPLFAAVTAGALDRWWDQMGRPDPFVVVEAAAGGGTLARDILAAGPACSPALRYVLVERS
jgi:SAM-dependent MidA family methyltransferase